MYFNKNEELAYNMGYRVDNDGDLLSNLGTKRFLKTPQRGYKKFCIKTNENKKINVFVHRLIAYQKFGQKLYENNMLVRHLNGISDDNSYENIEIGTQSDNMMDQPENVRKRKAKYANMKYKNEELKNILSYYNESKSYKKTMTKFNISSKGTLWHIVNNRID